LTITEISKSRNRPFFRTSGYVSSLEKLGLVEKTKHGDKTVTVRSLVEINEKGELKFRE
jgi:predicted transcriptional regulator